MPSPSPHRLKSGAIRWQVKYRIDGKVVTDTFETERAASEFCRLIERTNGAAARERLRSRREPGAGTAPTFKDWTDTYLDPASGILTGITPGTRHGYRRIADKALVPFFGEYPVNHIGRDDIGKWVQWVEAMPSGREAGKLVSAKTVKNYQNLLSSILGAAEDRELIARNPAKGVKITEGVSREGVMLTPHEFDQILAHIPPHYQPLVVFLVDTGARWGEATALTWADVDLSVRPVTARINKAWKKGVDGKPVLGTPKSKKSRRTVPVSDTAVEYLPAQRRPADLVFAGVEGGKLWYGMFNTRIWKPAVEKADVGKSPNIHDLRHTAASWLVMGGIPITDVQAQLGHEKADTTSSIYSHLSPDTHVNRVRVMDAAMRSVRRPTRELTVR